MKKPTEGDVIRHNLTFPVEESLVGTVDWVGAAQFAYVTKEGRRVLCLLTEDWIIYKEQQHDLPI